MKIYIVLKAQLQEYGEFAKVAIFQIHSHKIKAEAYITSTPSAWNETIDGVNYICEQSICETEVVEDNCSKVYVIIRVSIEEYGMFCMVTAEKAFSNPLEAQQFVAAGPTVWNEKYQNINYVCERGIFEGEIIK